MKFTNQSFIACLVGLLFSPIVFAQTAPSWFDVKAHTRQIQNKMKSSGGSYHKADLEKFNSKKIDMGSHKLTLVMARFGPGGAPAAPGAAAEKNAEGKAEASNVYDLSELYAEPPEPPKSLLQLIDADNCNSQKAEDMTVRKLGFVNEVQIYFVQLMLASPSCQNSEVSSPKMFLIFQEKKSGIEKVFQSEIAKNGKYKVDFQKDHIHFVYNKATMGPETAVDLSWDDKLQKFSVDQDASH